jgi:putative transcriptional regulator
MEDDQRVRGQAVGRRQVLSGLAVVLLPGRRFPGGAAAALAAADEPVTANPDGQLLVASRDLSDAGFAEAVIYILAHDEGGAVGLIVNRPAREVALTEVFGVLGLDAAGVAGRITVYAGGPVEPERPFLIHTPETMLKDSKALPGGVALTNDPAMLRAIGRGKGPTRYLLAFGYVGWAGGQLEAEIARGDWFAIPPELSLIFATEPERSWEKALQRRPTAL